MYRKNDETDHDERYGNNVLFNCIGTSVIAVDDKKTGENTEPVQCRGDEKVL